VILTQSHCVVCAVSDDDVARALIPGLEPKPRLVSLAPNNLQDLWTSIGEVAEAIGIDDRGQSLIRDLQERMTSIVDARNAVFAARLDASSWLRMVEGSQPRRPKVACLEWLDPLMAAGNWVPELVEMAGGDTLFGVAGQHSPWMTWDDLIASDADTLIAMPCGFDLDRTREEMRAFTTDPRFKRFMAARLGRIFIVDGNQFFNRPGPRLVESLAILDWILHDPLHDSFEGAGRLQIPIGTFTEALRSGRTLVMDGAMGTELIRAGITGPTWDVPPIQVLDLHSAYSRAGAEILVTNTFLIGHASKSGANFESAKDAAQAHVRMARSARPGCWTFGSIGPAASGPNFTDRELLLDCVATLADAHGILLETCSDESAFAAVAWIRERLPDLPVLVSFAFAPNQEAKAMTLARLAERSDIAALGVNCGRDQSPADVGRTLRLFRQETNKPLFARPNAGTPRRDGSAWVYPLDPEEWAAETAKLCEIGLAMVGGCCGTTPEHIAALYRICRAKT